MNMNSNLGHERMRESELRQGIHCNGELANANKADAELGNGDETTGKLTNRNNTFSRYRWTPSFGQENAEIKLGSQVLRD